MRYRYVISHIATNAVLVKSKEPLGGLIISCHNLYYYKNLMENIRFAIESNNFEDFKKEFYFNRDSS